MTSLFSIPKPCSENWNEMDGSAQGAFCAKCTKEVVDCTTIKTSEIKATLALKKSPCVRIFKEQVNEMNFLEWFGSISLRKQLKYAFLFAYLIVFNSVGMGQDPLTHSNSIAVETRHLELDIRPLDSLRNSELNDTISRTYLNDSIPNSTIEIADSTSCSPTEIVTIPLELSAFPKDLIVDYKPDNETYIVEQGLTMGFLVIETPVEDTDRSPFLANARNAPPIITDSPNLSLGNSRYSFHIVGDSLRFFSYALNPERIEIFISKKGQNNALFYQPLKIERGPNERIFPLNDFDNGNYIITIKGEKSENAIALTYL